MKLCRNSVGVIGSVETLKVTYLQETKVQGMSPLATRNNFPAAKSGNVKDILKKYLHNLALCIDNNALKRKHCQTELGSLPPLESQRLKLITALKWRLLVREAGNLDALNGSERFGKPQPKGNISYHLYGVEPESNSI